MFLELYERTYNNCVFYRESGKKKELLNEIGALRGIAYCIEAAVGEDNMEHLIDYPDFVKMIALQPELMEEK